MGRVGWRTGSGSVPGRVAGRVRRRAGWSEGDGSSEKRIFWSEHSYVEYSTIYRGFSTLRRKSVFLRRIKISCSFLA